MMRAAISQLLEDSVAGYWGVAPGTAAVDVKVIRNGDMKSEGGIRWGTLPSRGFSITETRKSRLRSGDVLITTSADCGQVALIDNEPTEVVCATNFVRVLRFVPYLYPRYAWHFMRTRGFRDALSPYVRGTTMKNLSTREAFPVVEVPLPPLEEQRRIAAILDHADALRAKRRQVLAHLDQLGRSVFQQMFASEASHTTVIDIATQTRTGPFGSQLLHGEFVESGVAVLGLDNVVGNRFRWAERRYITPAKYKQLERYTVNPGDVLISIMGTTGRCVVVPEDIPVAVNTKHICAITVDRDRIEPQFLRAAFLWAPKSRAYLRQQTKGSIMDGLNMGIIRAMPVPLPIPARQLEFTRRIEGIDSLRMKNERAFAADERLFSSLQSRAFRGEL